MFLKKLIIILLIISFTSCKNKEANNTNKYIFLSHTYEWYTLDKVDHRVPKLNLKQYDMVWLGGDLCVQSSTNPKTLQYLDSIYNLKSPNTLWAVGNHDILKGSIDSITNTTKKKSFYTISRNNITVSLLNTNIELSYPDSITRQKKYLEQYRMLKNISDTISKSTHFFIIGHNIVWEKMDSYINTKAHTAKSDNFDIDPSKSFTPYIYPLLKKIKNKNIKVTWIAGDIGKWLKKYEFWSKDSILFMANGINNTQYFKMPKKLAMKNRDKALVFEHNLTNDSITWEFYDINFLVEMERIKEKGSNNDYLDRLCLSIDSTYKNKTTIIKVNSTKIRTTAKWNKYIVDYSNENDITYSQKLYIEALFPLETQRKVMLNNLDSATKVRDHLFIPKSKRIIILSKEEKEEKKKQEIIIRIKKDSIWYNKIKLKAQANQKSINKQLEIEVEWLLKGKK